MIIRMIQLFNADCLEKMKDISSNSVDLIICDLPFGCLADNRKKMPNIYRTDNGKPLPQMNERITGCSWDIKIDLEAFWKEIKRIRKNDHTPCLHFCTTKYGFDLWESNKKEFRYDLVWDKGRGVSFLSANKMPMRSHEMIYVFSKAGAYYNRVDISGDFPAGKRHKNNRLSNVYNTIQIDTKDTPSDKRCALSVIDINNYAKKGQHPTAKPIEIYKFLIERYCPEGGTVLDPTFGSCNSGLACKELGRNYIGIEKDKEFFKKAESALTV